jgi:predicted small lipoprotein YifL
MNTLKSLVTAVALTFALAVAAVGQTAPLCVPGHTETPPCPSAQATSEEPVVAPGETQMLPEAQSVEIASLVELALHALLLA